MLAALLLAVTITWAPQPPAGLGAYGTCVRVVDGDTIEVEYRMRVRLRLDQCWAPESRTRDLEEKRRGLDAKQNMERLVLGKPVFTHIPATEEIDHIGELTTLGRAVARVWVVGMPKSISQQQVEAGHAETTKAELEQTLRQSTEVGR